MNIEVLVWHRKHKNAKRIKEGDTSYRVLKRRKNHKKDY